MKRILLLCVTAATAVLTSCVDPYYGQNAGYPGGGGYPSGGSGGYGGSSSQAYRSGQTDGTRDKAYNRPYNPYRGQSSVPGPYQDSYRNGYASGYRNASTGGGGENWGGGNNGGNWGGGGSSNNQSYYNQGYAHGSRDKRSGQTYYSARHWDNVPAGERLNFNKGYAAGWAQSNR